MKELVVGTYFAEQVSLASYDLISVAHSGQHRRPGTHQSSVGRGALPAVPASARGRRRHIQEQEGTNCTVLPALEKIEPLLPDMDDKGVATAEDLSEAQERRQQMREARKMAEAERIRKSSARLCRGERSGLRRPTERATPSDEEVLHQLTQPWGTFPCQPSGGLSTCGSQARMRQRGPLCADANKTYADVFRMSLAGTDLAGLPIKLRSPLAQPCQRRRPGHIRTKFTGLLEVKIVPQDPVEAFFKMEKAAMPEDHFFAQRRSQVRDMFKHAVYKEGGALAQARGRGFGRKGSSADTRRNVRGTPQPWVELEEQPGVRLAQSSASPEAADSKAEPLGAASASAAVAADGAAAATPASPLPRALPVILTPPALAVERPDSRTQLTQKMVGIARRMAIAGDSTFDALLPKQKISPVRRELCQLLRYFVYGTLGNENRTGAKEKEKVYYEAIGTKTQVEQLFAVWDKLDSDDSGCVELSDVRTIVERLISDLRQDCRPLISGGQKKDDALQLQWLASSAPEDNAKFVSKMCDRLSAALVGKKSSFTISDLMRMIFPCSATADLKQMRAWCDEFALSNARWRVPTPKVLPHSELEALAAVFRHFDKDGSGTVSAEELVHSGLLDKETAHRYVHEVDNDGSGDIDLAEFCELMCPEGFRASSRSEMGTSAEGQRVVLDKQLGAWRLQDQEAC